MKNERTTPRGQSWRVSSRGAWRTLAWLATCALLWMLGSCKPPPPQIMLRIETDIPQGPNGILNAVHVRLISAETGQAFFDRSIVLDEATKLPGDVAISWDGRFPLLDARVSAMQRQPGSTPARYERLFEVRAVATFPESDAVTLWVYLANRCLLAENRNCPRGFTCGRYGCEPETRGELRPTREDAGPPEATVVSALDAGRDASMDGFDAADSSRCAAGQTLCDGACVDLSTDSNHCGGCGQRCRTGGTVEETRCERGRCRIARCRQGTGDCDGDPMTGCETNLESSLHCGACGRTCDGMTPVCSSGVCVSGCVSGEILCGSSCVDPRTNWQHCGDCNQRCPEVVNGSPVCLRGRCEARCNTGYADCDGNPANGCETNLVNSVSHCGSCGVACVMRPNARPVCTMGTCSYECVPGYGDCDGDASNGCEVDLSSSLEHCGRCAQRCAAGPNQSASCSMGMCTIQCRPGYEDCNRMARDGCEASLSDPMTCGSCANLCTGSMALCSEGMCSMMCGPSQTLCSGTCVDTNRSIEHCGRCGIACPEYRNAMSRCDGGGCAFDCAMDYADCNGQRRDGCEVYLPSSPFHCGRCGHRCPAVSNSTPTCSGGTCGFICHDGYGDCDGAASNGCETNLTNSVGHCGACGNACPLGPHSTPVCSMGECGLQCDPGWVDADENPSNGCERNDCRAAGEVCMGDNPCRLYRVACDHTTGGLSCVPVEPRVPILEGESCDIGRICRMGECVSIPMDAGDAGDARDAPMDGLDGGMDGGYDSGGPSMDVPSMPMDGGFAPSDIGMDGDNRVGKAGV